jgi:hypothetical protein
MAVRRTCRGMDYPKFLKPVKLPACTNLYNRAILQVSQWALCGSQLEGIEADNFPVTALLL